MEFCDIKNCRDEYYMVWCGKNVCKKHWLRHCDDKKKFNLKTAQWKEE